MDGHGRSMRGSGRSVGGQGVVIGIHEKNDFCGGDGFFKNPYKIPKFGGKSL